MALGNLFKSLLGSGSSEPQIADPVSYKGFSIEAAPIEEDGKFRTSGFISGEHEGETKRIQFIRADLTSTRETAEEHSVNKARQIIDEQGAELLQKTRL